MTDLFKLILGILASRFKARATLEAENLVLRQQINVLRRQMPSSHDLSLAASINNAESNFSGEVALGSSNMRCIEGRDVRPGRAA